MVDLDLSQPTNLLKSGPLFIIGFGKSKICTFKWLGSLIKGQDHLARGPPTLILELGSFVIAGPRSS